MSETPHGPFPDPSSSPARGGMSLDQGIRLLWERGPPAPWFADPTEPSPPCVAGPHAAQDMPARSDIRVIGALRLRRRPRPLGDPIDPIDPPGVRLPRLGELVGVHSR